MDFEVWILRKKTQMDFEGMDFMEIDFYANRF